MVGATESAPRESGSPRWAGLWCILMSVEQPRVLVVDSHDDPVTGHLWDNHFSSREQAISHNNDGDSNACSSQSWSIGKALADPISRQHLEQHYLTVEATTACLPQVVWHISGFEWHHRFVAAAHKKQVHCYTGQLHPMGQRSWTWKACSNRFRQLTRGKLDHMIPHSLEIGTCQLDSTTWKLSQTQNKQQEAGSKQNAGTY